MPYSIATALRTMTRQVRDSAGIVEIVTALVLFLLVLMLAGHRVVVQ